MEKLKTLSWKLQCDIVSHVGNAFIPLSLLGSVPFKESLVCVEASGFYHVIDAGLSLGFFLDILLLPCFVEILKLWV